METERVEPKMYFLRNVHNPETNYTKKLYFNSKNQENSRANIVYFGRNYFSSGSERLIRAVASLR
ncbi:hypothetical protein G9C98_000955 [Cotesia typhae]|uniref:Uncharacterized protein n=1 Tax=Cotesia typhae TaxID=2053667 RepID=A0A8J5VC68_9HYME|nr:hypothetical protein G9C98_000955 [Cotesia typhae]